MRDLLQDLFGNVTDRLREPLCMASSIMSEQAKCDLPDAIPVQDFVLWSFIPVSDDFKMSLKTPLCDAAGAMDTLFNCD